jgi:deoxyribonuclease-4
MSIAGGVSQALVRGHSIGCEAIQIFTKNQLRWAEPEIPSGEIAAFGQLQDQTGIHPIASHNSYLINLGSPDDSLWRRSVNSLIRELHRCEALAVPYVNMHPGSHVGSGEDAGMRRIAQGLDAVHGATSGLEVMTLLETTAGQGTNLGYAFGQLGHIIEMVRQPERMGICFDTCHSFAAGYDLRTHEGYADTFAELDRLVGLERLKVFHLNGSRGALGSRLDRHCHITEGELGLDAFRMLLNDPRFEDRAMLLETPKGKEMEEDIANLAVLRSLLA